MSLFGGFLRIMANEDFYATEPKAAKLLLELETFS